MHARRRFSQVGRGAAVLGVLLVLTGCVKWTVLGSLTNPSVDWSPTGVNAGGVVAGTIDFRQAVSCTLPCAHPTLLQVPAGYDGAVTTAVMPDGSIVGYALLASGGFQAVVWDGATHIPTLLAQPVGDVASQAIGVGADGSIVGQGLTGDLTFPGALVPHPVVWAPTTRAVTSLIDPSGGHAGSAAAVGADGTIGGYVLDASGKRRATIWAPTTHLPTMLPTVAGQVASDLKAIAPDGTLAGQYTGGATNEDHAVVWDAATHAPTALPEPVGDSFTFVFAAGADNSIIGSDAVGAVRWAPTTHAVAHDPPPTGLGFTETVGAAADGTIVGLGLGPSGFEPVVWDHVTHAASVLPGVFDQSSSGIAANAAGALAGISNGAAAKWAPTSHDVTIGAFSLATTGPPVGEADDGTIVTSGGYVWDPISNSLSQLVLPGPALGVSPAGTVLGYDQGVLKPFLWSLTAHTLEHLDGRGPTHTAQPVAIGPNDTVVGDDGAGLVLWTGPAHTRTSLTIPAGLAGPWTAAVGPDGTVVGTSCSMVNVVWEPVAHTPTVVPPPAGFTAPHDYCTGSSHVPGAVGVLPDGRVVVSLVASVGAAATGVFTPSTNAWTVLSPPAGISDVVPVSVGPTGVVVVDGITSTGSNQALSLTL